MRGMALFGAWGLGEMHVQSEGAGMGMDGYRDGSAAALTRGRRGAFESVCGRCFPLLGALPPSVADPAPTAPLLPTCVCSTWWTSWPYATRWWSTLVASSSSSRRRCCCCRRRGRRHPHERAGGNKHSCCRQHHVNDRPAALSQGVFSCRVRFAGRRILACGYFAEQ